MKKCLFCNFKEDKKGKIVFENGDFICIEQTDDVMIGWCLIVPKRHVETPFELTDKEWISQSSILLQAKKYLDTKHKPDGYNLGWNVGKTAGQTISHVHLHIFCRFNDESTVGRGIRWIKRTN